MNAFPEQDLPALAPTEKVALLATVSPEGLPHLTLITTLQPLTPTQMVWGQFTAGRSKQHVLENPCTGFLIMTLDRRVWRGRARYTHREYDGDAHRMLNAKPMFRYNSYFGIHTAHFMDVVDVTPAAPLPLGRIVPAALLTAALRRLAGTGVSEPILTPWAVDLFNSAASLKFLAWVGEDGFPAVVPVLQCRAADSRRLVFSPAAYGAELRRIPRGTPVAVFGLTLEMEDVLVRGTYAGLRRVGPARLGVVDLEWVYNSMPPTPGVIYPRQPLQPVRDFS